VTGASAGLDMRGQTKVANVILKTDLVALSGNWQAVMRRFEAGRVTASVDGSATMGALGGELTVSLEAGQTQGGFGGPGGGVRSSSSRQFYDSADVQYEEHRGIGNSGRIEFAPAFEFKRKLGWGDLRLNGSLSANDSDSTRYAQIHAPNITGPISRYELQDIQNDSLSYSFGGDVEFPLAGALVKLVAVREQTDNQNDSLYSYNRADGSLDRSLRVRADDVRGETILRAQANWKLSDAHAIEMSIEGAYNFLDSTRTLTTNTGLDVTPAGSDTIVEEYRAEAQIADVWTLSPQLTIEPQIKFEFSRIQQEGRLSATSSVYNEREFTYPKPGITATWRPNGNQQARVALFRQVNQLEFNDFVSSVEVFNDRVSAGNAELEPEKSWTLQTELEQKFWEGGVFTLIASFDQVEDVEDVVPVTPLGGSIADGFDGPGNLGDGERWSLGFRTAIPLRRLGVQGGRLDIDLRSGNSEVTDPVTGDIREFSDEFNRNWNIRFRQDLRELGFSYGFSYGESGGGTSYRLKETFKRQRSVGDLSVFLETSKLYGLNVRLGYNDILKGSFTSNRVLYSGPRGSSPQLLRQTSSTANGPFAYIRVAGSF